MMNISKKEFSFKSAHIKRNAPEYDVKWAEFCTFDGKTVITIRRPSIITGGCDHINFCGGELSNFIKDLQTLAEFMRANGLLPKEEESEDED